MKNRNELIKKLIYRSNHMGTRELDMILGKFAEENLDKMSYGNILIYELFLDSTNKKDQQEIITELRKIFP